MIKNILILILIVTGTAMQISAAESASQLLEQAAGKFSTAKSIKANYTLTSSEGGMTKGSVVFSGEKFAMTSPDILTWYDGTTQWSYLVANEEVNISEPTPEELQQINPFAVINKFRNAYTAKLLSSDAATKKIMLTAKSVRKSDILMATVTLNATTLFPSKITLTFNGGQTVSIAISSVTQGNALPISAFRFPAAKYPGAEVIDLR